MQQEIVPDDYGNKYGDDDDDNGSVQYDEKEQLLHCDYKSKCMFSNSQICWKNISSHLKHYNHHTTVEHSIIQNQSRYFLQ